MNINKYEFDSTDEMLKLSDFHFDQNVDPVQGPEDQAREAQGPEDQAREAQGPENQAPEDQAPEDQAPEAQGLEVQAQNETMQTQRATLVDLQALWKKNIDGLAHDNIELLSNMKVIEQQNRMLDFDVAFNEDLRRVVNRRKIKTSQVVPNSGPPGMMMPFGVPHNNFAPNPYQQAAQAHARMQQQQQPRLVPPSRTNVASGKGADAARSDAGGGDDTPGQGP